MPIIIRLAGGLGNQIFQLGAGLLIAQKNNTSEILLDESSLKKYNVKRNNELLRFFDFNNKRLRIRGRKIFFLFSQLRIPVLFPLQLKRYPFASDKNFQTILKYPSKSIILLDGYFQECLTQDNFNEEIDILRSIFKEKLYSVNNSGCVVHIRGGDFLKLGWDSITPKEYYYDAIYRMATNFKINRFYIVTDDKKYSIKLLDGLDFKYQFIGGNMLDDFYLFGNFKYRILSSSTFALWASVLGSEDAYVIAPQFWRPNKKRIIYLPNEKRIDFE